MRNTCLLLMLLFPLLVNAQTVKVISSASTDWSGGVAGHAGTRYTFSIAFAGFDKNGLQPDTLWIGDKPTALKVKENDKGDFNTTRSTSKGKVTYTINAAIDRSTHIYSPEPYGLDHKEADAEKPPLKYKGVALLAYHYKGRISYFVIDKIITKYPPISYP